MDARLALARAVTVAVRYLSIRRQFQDKDAIDDSAPEMAVLDYPTVQIRVLPLLATTFALHYSGKAMGELYESTRENIESKGDFATLAELHSTSSGLKSLATDLTANGIETCRRAMGGHGFGEGTGLVQLNANYLSQPTVEGDNWMITQQVARYLIKKVRELSKTSKAPTTKTEANLKNYLQAQNKKLDLNVLQDDDMIVRAFEWRAAHYVSRTGDYCPDRTGLITIIQAFQAYEQREVQKKPWTSLLIDFHKLSRGMDLPLF